MDVTTLLLLLFVGAVITFIAGDKLASKVALLFSAAALGVTVYLLTTVQQFSSLNVSYPWISTPKAYFALKVDGLSLAMVLLTTALTPLIILSSFANQFKS